MAYWHKFLCFIGKHDWCEEELIDLLNGDTISYAKCNCCGKYKVYKVNKD